MRDYTALEPVQFRPAVPKVSFDTPELTPWYMHGNDSCLNCYFFRESDREQATLHECRATGRPLMESSEQLGCGCHKDGTTEIKDDKDREYYWIFRPVEEAVRDRMIGHQHDR